MVPYFSTIFLFSYFLLISSKIVHPLFQDYPGPNPGALAVSSRDCRCPNLRSHPFHHNLAKKKIHMQRHSGRLQKHIHHSNLSYILIYGIYWFNSRVDETSMKTDCFDNFTGTNPASSHNHLTNLLERGREKTNTHSIEQKGMLHM